MSRSSLAVALLALNIGTAAAEEYTSRTSHSDEGLPHNIVRSLAQMGYGYLWVGIDGTTGALWIPQWQ